MDLQPHATNSDRKIIRLPNHLINQIAAGEVVERPASVVKELVENAIDAGSSRIEVHLKDGGMQEIGILDNGVGMSREDLFLCVERHTTSKLKSEADLEAIGTFGFRGEALSSIASVSEVEIRTRQAQELSAQTLKVCFGTLDQELRPTGAPVGTSVFVRKLFEQLPARHKFLKTIATELSHVVRTVREIALGNPETTFSLFHQGNLLHQWTAKGREARFREVFKITWAPLHLNESQDAFQLEAFLSPSHLVTDRGDLYLYINSRPVKHRALLAAVRNAYRDSLGPHHEPSGVLYFDIQKDWVDVNVHPQKLEVRLLNQERIYGWLTATLRKVVSAEPKAVPPMPTPTKAFPVSPVSKTWRPPTQESRPPLIREPVPQIQIPLQKQSPYRFLGQVKESYLVCEDQAGIVFFEQHALHEKILFEKLKKEPLSVQRLLVPHVFRLAPELQPSLEQFRPTFLELGFDIDFFGDGDIAIKSRPSLLDEQHLENVVKASLKILGEKEGLIRQSRDAVLASVACYSAVRAGDKLADFEAYKIIQGLDEISPELSCPHGRPALFRLDFLNLEKHFDRK